jgi:hypothetical protein
MREHFVSTPHLYPATTVPMQVVVILYTKEHQDALFTFSFIPINNLYMFRAGLLVIIIIIIISSSSSSNVVAIVAEFG